jgi:outer membrane protein
MKKLLAVFGVMILLASNLTFAQKAGDTIVNIGLAYIAPTPSVSTPIASGTVAASTFNNALRGTEASIDNVTTLSFSIMRMFTDNVAGEVSLGIPPELSVTLNLPNGTIPPKFKPNAAKATAYTPALVAKYLFNEPSSQIRPYIGLGVTHASFKNIKISDDATVQLLAGTSASMSSSWAPVYNFGFIYNIDQKWSINTSVSYIPLKSEITMLGSGGGAGLTTKSTLTINPTDYIVRIGYKF